MTLTNARLIQDAALSLTRRGFLPFARIDVYRAIWRVHGDRQRGSLDPTFQGMVVNAPGGPTSACGTPLRRVSPGRYVIDPSA